ncbi:cobalt-zinc-cadmium efflux system protein [Methanofollis sp. W23]|uniref:cation diffusion facilitator family transporter n=1 Tax=Methanofollis sp. W23 TaxID=2817849 RepID=UPI001AE29FBF|nr:cation diffusion facilitator family transporter [Methanofollis sp. W23]MBP2146632.1 cobalt-zinc-cadmium efflux system protein [Methanofollis sp. W23]
MPFRKGDERAALKVAVVLTTGFLVVEAVAGVLSGSLALIGDAGHMFRDVLALLLSLGAVVIAERLPTRRRTWGYHRVEVFVALVNGTLLIVLAGTVIWEAFRRLADPVPVAGPLMAAVGVVGLVVNLYVAWRLHGAEDLNVRSAYLHVVGDTLSSVAVVVAAAWIAVTDQTIVDPLLSIGIALVILAGSVSLLRETVGILLQFVPRGIDFDEVVMAMESVDGVEEVHNIHLWALCSHINVLDAHVVACTDEIAKIEEIKAEIKQRLREFDVQYSILEFEQEPCPESALLRRVKGKGE